MAVDELVRVEVSRVLPSKDGGGAAVILSHPLKSFVIYIGIFEATAIINELHRQRSPRPLTHDLIHNVFLGFDIAVRRVVISSLVDSTFCATLFLEQKLGDAGGAWEGKRNEVRIDARASDSIVIALKERCELYVARKVFDVVEDVSPHLPTDESPTADEPDDGDEDEA